MQDKPAYEIVRFHAATLKLQYRKGGWLSNDQPRKFMAFFSGTDNTELNPFFKSSIVVAQAKTALGFSYKAEGKVILPCGSIGKIDFFLKVTDSERWNAVEKHEYDGKAGFGDCDQLITEVVDTETETITKRVAPVACGLSSEDKAERAFVFGCAGGEQLLTEIQAQSVGRAPDEKVFGGYHYGGNSGSSGVGKLSRRERRRLRREGKLSAQSSGTYSMGASGAIDACAHGVLLTVDCLKCEAEDNRPDRFTPSDEPPPHQVALGVMVNSKEPCEFDLNGQHKNEKLYLYLAKSNKWRMWLCAECYDWWMEGARESFEDDVEQEKLANDRDECRHGVSLYGYCKACEDMEPKQLSDGTNRWDKLAKEILTAEDYEKAKKEHVQSLFNEVERKEERAKALKVSERLGIVSGTH
jgi:hypothetical protein